MKGTTDKERKQLWREYRTILARADRPREKDIARLGELLPALGLNETHVEAHLRVLAEVNEHGAIAKKLAALETRRAKVDSEMRELIEQRNSAQRRLEDDLLPDHNRIVSELQQCDAADSRVRTLERAYPMFLTGNVSAKAVPIPDDEVRGWCAPFAGKLAELA